MADENKVLTPEEVIAQEKLNDSVSLDLASKEDAEVEGFLPLMEGMYKMTIEAAEVREQKKYRSEELEKKIMVTFIIDECITGSKILDTEKTEQKAGERKFWEWLSTTSTGFQVGGSPSKTRAFLAAVYNTSVDEPIKMGNVSELVGKACNVYLEVAKKQDGTPKNKAMKYSSITE